MIAAALRKIEANLRRHIDEDHPLSMHEIRVLAEQICSQAEMVERGLAE